MSINNAALAAAAMFELKSPSMHQFEDSANDETVKHNITTLFGITSVPSDTTMREVLGPVETTYFQDPYTKIFSMAQRGKVKEVIPFVPEPISHKDGTKKMIVKGMRPAVFWNDYEENILIKKS